MARTAVSLGVRAARTGRGTLLRTEKVSDFSRSVQICQYGTQPAYSGMRTVPPASLRWMSPGGLGYPHCLSCGPVHVKSLHAGCCRHAPRQAVRGWLGGLEDTQQFVASLTKDQQESLREALEEVEREDREVEAPSWLQLRLLCYQQALPFIGFGFLDNFVMIMAGEYIDWTIGVTLGISTMAAAGFGNIISDLAGLGLADQVEAVCKALGIPSPNISSSQAKHRSTRWMALLGRCAGITIGCFIGMFPLLWFEGPHKHSSDTE